MPIHMTEKPDLFTSGRSLSVVRGGHGALRWDKARDQLAHEIVEDEAGQEYLVVPGTQFVANKSGAQGLWAVWKGGLTGECLKGGIGSVSEVLTFIRSQMPPAEINKLRRET